MSSILIQLKKTSKSFFKEYKNEIKDIIIFGSLMRGKLKPEDIDILIIFRKKIDKEIEYKLRRLFFKIKNISILSKTEENYKAPSFDAREGILFEGYSLIKSKLISSEYGFLALGLFLYQTNNLTNLEKTKFYYALNGRGESRGVVDALEGIKLSDNLIAVPLNKIEPAREFFEYWKLDYKYIPSLVPERLGKKGIIGKVR